MQKNIITILGTLVVIVVIVFAGLYVTNPELFKGDITKDETDSMEMEEEDEAYDFDIEDDFDEDGVPDASDNCPYDANPDQGNFDGDGEGNECDEDDDNDGIPDTIDQFPFDPNNKPPQDTQAPDEDGDGIPDIDDNCPDIANPNQEDGDQDGLGDDCDPDVIEITADDLNDLLAEAIEQEPEISVARARIKLPIPPSGALPVEVVPNTAEAVETINTIGMTMGELQGRGLAPEPMPASMAVIDSLDNAGIGNVSVSDDPENPLSVILDTEDESEANDDFKNQVRGALDADDLERIDETWEGEELDESAELAEADEAGTESTPTSDPETAYKALLDRLYAKFPQALKDEIETQALSTGDRYNLIAGICRDIEQAGPNAAWNDGGAQIIFAEGSVHTIEERIDLTILNPGDKAAKGAQTMSASEFTQLRNEMAAVKVDAGGFDRQGLNLDSLIFDLTDTFKFDDTGALDVDTEVEVDTQDVVELLDYLHGS